MILTEGEMRRALGLEPDAKKLQEEVRKEKRIFPHTVVIYSVRKVDGGSTFKYEYKSRSISLDIVKLEAEKEIREQGLVVWALLDIQQIS